MECAAIVWAVKKNRQLFYGIAFVVVSDYQPLKNSRAYRQKLTEYNDGMVFSVLMLIRWSTDQGRPMAIQT